MEWYFQAVDARQALSARRAFVAFLRESCTPESDYYGAEAVFGELVANVVLHARGPIEIVVKARSEGTVTLDVCDTGPAFAIAPSLPPISKQGGRGLYIISRLSANPTIERIEGDGKRVSVVLPVTAHPRNPRVHRNGLVSSRDARQPD
jgi:anti-sigma regulatory factor (Ser/Thr protein kinase)